MSGRSDLQVLGALFVLAVAIVSTGVIAMGFLAPERMFESNVGLGAFLLAGTVMVPLAVIANRYDLKGILTDAFL